MILAVISDAVWNALIAAVVAISLAWITRHEARKQTAEAKKAAEGVKEELRSNNAIVSKEVSDVRNTLEAKTTSTEEAIHGLRITGEKTLDRVNGAMTVQLKLMALTARRLADLSKDPADKKAAEMAATALRDHEAAISTPQS